MEFQNEIEGLFWWKDLLVDLKHSLFNHFEIKKVADCEEKQLQLLNNDLDDLSLMFVY